MDKLSKPFVKAYYDYYLDKLKEATGGLMGKRGLHYLFNDNWERGQGNWTDEMMAEFKRRRGYDMTPWLPALVGHVVESAEASDRFLWDFRKTIAEMTAEYTYDQLSDMLKERGMGRNSQGHEFSRVYVVDGMDVKRSAAVPMGVAWAGNPGGDRIIPTTRTSAKPPPWPISMGRTWLWLRHFPPSQSVRVAVGEAMRTPSRPRRSNRLRMPHSRTG